MIRLTQRGAQIRSMSAWTAPRPLRLLPPARRRATSESAAVALPSVWSKPRDCSVELVGVGQHDAQFLP